MFQKLFSNKAVNFHFPRNQGLHMFAMLLALGARTSSDVTTVGGAKGCAMAHGRIGLEIS